MPDKKEDVSAPADPAEYRKAMGYINLLDLLTGNGDRMYSMLNTGNWLEERDKKQIHLIDNDYSGGFGLHKIDDQKTIVESDWDRMVGEKFKGKSDDKLQNFMDSISTKDDQNGKNVFGSSPKKQEDFMAGMRESAADLPELYKQLKATWKKGHEHRTPEEKGHEHMTPEEKELLRRIKHLSHILNPKKKDDKT